jgi:hypothetical protein
MTIFHNLKNPATTTFNSPLFPIVSNNQFAYSNLLNAYSKGQKHDLILFLHSSKVERRPTND